jgi:hypothetical protein
MCRYARRPVGLAAVAHVSAGGLAGKHLAPLERAGGTLILFTDAHGADEVRAYCCA